MHLGLAASVSGVVGRGRVQSCPSSRRGDRPFLFSSRSASLQPSRARKNRARDEEHPRSRFKSINTDPFSLVHSG
jgi:hypothetical protein